MPDKDNEILILIQKMFESMNTKIDELQNELKNTNTELFENTEKLDSVISDLSKIKLIAENELKPNIILLAEGYKPMSEKVDSLQEDMEVVKFDIDIIKKVVTTHSSELNKLGKAK